VRVKIVGVNESPERAACRRALEEADRRELLYTLPILDIFQQVANALDVTSRNLVGSAEIERERKTGMRQRRPYRFRLSPQRALPEDEEHDARVIDDSAIEALNAIARVMEKSLEAALLILESEDPKQRKYGAALLVDQLNRTIERLLWLSTAPWNKGLRAVATERMEFPSLMSLSQKVNNDRADLVLHQLKLGKKLPFHVDPRTTYTAYTLLAMEIISFINTDRRRDDSIYRLVNANFEKKDFSKAHYSAWSKVIAFHLDFFQSPDARRRKFCSQQDNRDLQNAMEARLSREQQDGFRRSTDLNPFGDISAMIEFRYRNLKEVETKPVRQFYNRVKHKVVDAALALMPD